MARVTSVDLEHRIVIVDIEEAVEVIRRALEALEKESSNQPLQGTPAKSPSSSTEPEGRRS